MALSIRSARAEQLARELATETGDCLTKAIMDALEEQLERLRGRRTAADLTEEVMAISGRCSALPDCDHRSPDEILGYGANGTFD